MRRLPETVTNKFTELFTVLHTATDDLKLAGAEANLLGDFSRVESLNDSCRKMQALEAEVRFALDNFGTNARARTGSGHRPHKGHSHHTRRPGARLRVKLGEQVIEEATIAETFVKTLRMFGLERVAKLNKVLASIPLVSKTPTNGYQTQKSCDGWYITAHVNLNNAKTLLEEIGRALNMPTKIEFVER